MSKKDVQFYVEGVLDGDRKVLSRTITLIESSLTAHQDLARDIIEEILPHTGNSVRLGITGIPGAGKSTFIERFGLNLTQIGKKVAVLAIDPSSTRSGGSIMADKTRMEKLSVDKNAFIRPSPAGSTLGGVALKTRETLLVCEAAGFDTIIVETVGVGQSETTVSSMVDFFLVLMITGAGDEIQGIKRGILELADGVAINKADGDNIEKAKKAAHDYENALSLFGHTSKNWNPPVLLCSSITGDGIDEIWNSVNRHRDELSKTGELRAKRQEQALQWMWSLVDEGLKDHFNKNPKIKALLPDMIRKVQKGNMEPTFAAKELLSIIEKR